MAIVQNTLDFLDANETLVCSVMESNVYPILLIIVSEQIVRDVKQMFRDDESRGAELLLSPDLMAQAYTGALINIARWWVKHKDRASKEDIIMQITKLISHLYGK